MPSFWYDANCLSTCGCEAYAKPVSFCASLWLNVLSCLYICNQIQTLVINYLVIAMVRTQIQLTEGQADFLKEMAQAQNVSVAELIRRSIDAYARLINDLTPAEKRQNALSIVGKYSAGLTDLSTNHDQYLVESYGDFDQ